MDENKVKNICDFYAITHKLQTTLRAGWVDCGVPAPRLQSVAEHVYATQMLALAVNTEFALGLDMGKVALLLAVHEIGECIIGDIPAYGATISREEKKRIEQNAVEKIAGLIGNPVIIRDLFLEFENKSSPEAKFCFLIDKLECCFQAKYHEDAGHLQWNGLNPNSAQKERIDKRWAQGYTRFSDFWIDAGIEQHFVNEPHFKAVAEYIIKNSVYGEQN